MTLELAFAVAITSLFVFILVLIDGSRKGCPSCGKRWARGGMSEVRYTELRPVDEYLNWKVFFDNHVLGFAPESAVTRALSSRIGKIEVYSCRYCGKPFPELRMNPTPLSRLPFRINLLMKLGLVMLVAFLADVSAMIALAPYAPGGILSLEFVAVYSFYLFALLASVGLFLQVMGGDRN